MLLANFIENKVQIVSGIKPEVMATLLVTHDEDDQTSYLPTGTNFVRVRAKVGNMGATHAIGFGNVFRDNFQAPIRSKSLGTQLYAIYLPLDTNLVSQLDELHRACPSESIFLEVEWHLVASMASRGATQQPNMYRVQYKPNPSESPRDPVLAIDPTKWIEILKAFGWPDRRLIEIRFSKIGINKWADSIRELAAADNAYERREDANVLIACERAFEAIVGSKVITSSQQQLEQSLESMLQSIPDAGKRATAAQMILWAILYCRRFKHTQPIDPAHPLFDVNSGDAELGLIITKSILSYLSKLW